MAVIETWFHQDLQEPVKVNYLNGNLFSNNGNGNRIGIVLTNNGENLSSISGTVSGYVVTADGSTVPCTGSKSGNRASILIPAAAYQPGSIFITVFVTDGTTVTTIGAVCTTVMRSRTNAQVDPGSTVTDWTQTINAAMQSVETAAANLGGIVAVPYASITFPVPLGKYTYYNNNLYRCITPIASSESFTAAHWIQVRLGDDVSDLKSAIKFQEDEQSKIADELYGSHDVYMGYQLGRYATNGYNYSLHSYMYSIKLPAGRYYFPEIDSAYDFSAIQYVSDSEGVTVFAYRYRTITENLPANCIVSVRKVSGQDLTPTEIKNITETFRIKKITAESGALDSLNEMAEEVGTWEEDVFGEDNPIIDLEPVQGYYLSGGFGGETSYVRWRTKNKIPAGTYKLTNSDPDYRYYWVDYVSDSSGTVVFNSRSDDVLYTDTNDFYLTFCHKDLNNITASDVTSRFTLQKIQTSNAIQAKVDRLYSTQNVVFMGDSIFGLERSYTSIPSLCGYYTGATTYNCAIGGTAALEHPNDYKYYDLGLLTDAIIAWGSGDTHAFDNQVAHQSDSGNPSYIPDVITTLKSLDFTKINVLVISIGANDWVMNFGTNDQILDAIKTSITNMVTAFPNLRVLLMNPPFKFKTDPSYIDCDTWVNNTGTTLTAFARRYKEVGEACHIQIINAMDDMGICRYNRSQWFIAGDGSHPNETGRRETAKLVSEYLKRYLYD